MVWALVTCKLQEFIEQTSSKWTTISSINSSSWKNVLPVIELTAKEFDSLEYLLVDPRQVITRDRILEKVWGYDFMGDSNIIEVYIRSLRLKLEATGEQRLIQTVRSVGYVLRD